MEDRLVAMGYSPKLAEGHECAALPFDDVHLPPDHFGFLRLPLQAPD
jgi:hypothetical protein